MSARRYPHELVVAPIVNARGTVHLPGSKSLSNRALLLAALAHGTSRLANVLDADDTRVMIAALRALGVAVEEDAKAVVVHGCGAAFPVREAELFLGNAGTAMRPLTAALAFSGGRYRLDGVARMRERPIGDLVDALNSAGARIAYLATPGFPPLQIEPATRLARDHVQVRGAVSSQFVSGLLMAAPLIAAEQGLSIEVPGSLISEPYVTMTLGVMRQFGVAVERNGNRYRVPRAAYAACPAYAVEGDASSASYFLALGAIAGGPVRVVGAGSESVQGDVAFADVVTAMGGEVSCGPDWMEVRRGRWPLRALEYDCTEIPDAAMTAAVLALFADGPTRLTGIGSWRVKETDRIAAMATELRKLGAMVEEGADWLRVSAPAALTPAAIDTYDDHRMAMCFALAACGGVPVTIRDPKCVAKTFPEYFEALAAVTTQGSDAPG
jgi:3-phosphoshikimate 1-carboxyvinyltransferase